jgi:hypothetical protein
MRQINFFFIALLFITFASITHAQPQRTKIAIAGLVHSHCSSSVTKLNTMHQQGDLIEVVGISAENQELRDYIKTLMPGVPEFSPKHLLYRYVREGL